MKTLKKIWNVLVLLLTGKGEIAEKAVEDDGILDFSGQGRDKFGK